MENKSKPNLARKLDDLGIDNMSILKPNILMYLSKIEESIQDYQENQERLLNEYKDNTVTVTKIVKDLGISRQTIYNNEILEKYIALSKEEQSRFDIFQINKNIIMRLEELEAICSNFHRKNLELEKLRVELNVVTKNYNDLLLKHEKMLKDSFHEHSKGDGKKRKHKLQVIPINKRNIVSNKE